MPTKQKPFVVSDASSSLAGGPKCITVMVSTWWPGCVLSRMASTAVYLAPFSSFKAARACWFNTITVVNLIHRACAMSCSRPQHAHLVYDQDQLLLPVHPGAATDAEARRTSRCEAVHVLSMASLLWNPWESDRQSR